MVESSKPHPASLVTNIKTCIPIVLDYDGTQYNNWFTLFQIHRRANLVIDHVKPKPKPVVEPAAKEDKPIDMALWQPLDDIVGQWIYGTISMTYIIPSLLRMTKRSIREIDRKFFSTIISLLGLCNWMPNSQTPSLNNLMNVVDLSLESREEAHITNTSSTVSQTTAGSSQNPANTRGGNSRTATVKQQRHPQQ
uniref:Uncharacterized protein n=1 Tax=Chenopodium quinoa TaxID=63459 RepID=A0A803MU06_CHEQI